MADTARGRLLADARDGAPEALGALLQSVGPYVRVVARGLRGRAPACASESDLVQEVMLQAARGFVMFRGTTVAEFVAWIRQIAVRTAGRATNGRPPHDRFADSADQFAASDTGPAEVAMRRELSIRMAEALARLPEEMQEVLLGRLVDRLDHDAIATRMGRSAGAVRMLYLRAVRRLREVYTE